MPLTFCHLCDFWSVCESDLWPLRVEKRISRSFSLRKEGLQYMGVGWYVVDPFPSETRELGQGLRRSAGCCGEGFGPVRGLANHGLQQLITDKSSQGYGRCLTESLEMSPVRLIFLCWNKAENAIQKIQPGTIWSFYILQPQKKSSLLFFCYAGCCILVMTFK